VHSYRRVPGETGILVHAGCVDYVSREVDAAEADGFVVGVLDGGVVAAGGEGSGDEVCCQGGFADGAETEDGDLTVYEEGVVADHDGKEGLT